MRILAIAEILFWAALGVFGGIMQEDALLAFLCGFNAACGVSMIFSARLDRAIESFRASKEHLKRELERKDALLRLYGISDER